jgi:hypothetical protein
MSLRVKRMFSMDQRNEIIFLHTSVEGQKAPHAPV